MLKSSFVINKRLIWYILFFIAFIRPEYLMRMSVISIFYNFYMVFVMGVTVLLFILSRKKLSKFSAFWMVFEGWIILVTILQAGNISFAINHGISILTIALFWDTYSQDTYKVCKCLYFVLAVFIVVNFVTLFLFPNGMYVTGVTNTASENWFLGFKNKQMIYFLPFMGLSFVLIKIEGFTWKKLMFVFVVIVSALYIKSSTTIIGIVVIILIGFLPFIRENYKVFNIFTYFSAALGMFIIIPIFRLQHLFSYLIVTVLHKSIDLTYRTYLWDRAFNAIKIHPIVGWGEQINAVKHALYNSQSIVSAHNQILEYLYTGGIVLIIIYITINLMLAKKMWKVKKSEVIQIASGIYLALQVALIAEVFVDPIIYMIYFILWHLSGLVLVENKHITKEFIND